MTATLFSLDDIISETANNLAAKSVIENPTVATPQPQPQPQPEPKTETLYKDAENYTRSARERFVPGHDTVSPKWEHTGSVVSSDSIRDQIKKTFPQEIEKTELVDINGRKTPHFGLFYAGECLSTAVKKGYTPHTREDVLTCIDAAREAFSQDEVKVSATWNEGHFICVRPTDFYRREIFGERDAVSPRLVIKAGYGASSFSAQLGWFRDCCNNLTWLKNEGSVQQSIKHTHSLHEHLAELIEDFRACAQGWDETVEHIRKAEEMKICLTDFLAEIYGPCPDETGRGKTIHKTRTEKIFRRVVSERAKTGRPIIDTKTYEISGWEAYNAIQGYSQHDATRKGNPGLLDRVIRASTDKYVKKAETLVFDHVLATAN